MFTFLQIMQVLTTSPHSPDIEVLGIACAPAATKEAESHCKVVAATAIGQPVQ